VKSPENIEEVNKYQKITRCLGNKCARAPKGKIS